MRPSRRVAASSNVARASKMRPNAHLLAPRALPGASYPASSLVVTPRVRSLSWSFDAGANAVMDRRRALAALLLFSLASCSRHEPLAPVNYSPSSSAEPSDVGIRTAIVQQSIRNYQGPCPCPYSAPTCQGGSAYDKTGNQSVYCYTKDIPVEMVTAYRANPGLRTSNGEASSGPLSITAPQHASSPDEPRQ